MNYLLHLKNNQVNSKKISNYQIVYLFVFFCLLIGPDLLCIGINLWLEKQQLSMQEDVFEGGKVISLQTYPIYKFPPMKPSLIN